MRKVHLKNHLFKFASVLLLLFFIKPFIICAQYQFYSDTTKQRSFKFFMKNPFDDQAKAQNFDIDLPFKSLVLETGKKSFFTEYPPKIISGNNLEFLSIEDNNLNKHIVKLSDLTNIKINFTEKYHINDVYLDISLSFLSSFALAYIDNGAIKENTAYGIAYLLPSIVAGGGLAGNSVSSTYSSPEKYFRYDRQWLWEIGFSYGYYPVQFYEKYEYGEYAYRIAEKFSMQGIPGIFVTFQKRYSPFSLLFRLYQIKNPSRVEFELNNERLLFCSGLKSKFYSRNKIGLSLNTGFFVETRNKNMPENLDYDPFKYFFGTTIEAELNYQLHPNLALNFSAGSMYSIEGFSRYPLFAGLSYTQDRPSGGQLVRFDNITITPFYQVINNQYRMDKGYLNVFGVWISIYQSKISELSYAFSIAEDPDKFTDRPYEFPFANTFRYAMKGHISDYFQVGFTSGFSYGSYFQKNEFELLFGPLILIKYNQKMDFRVSFEKGLIEILDDSEFSNSSGYFTLGLSFKMNN